MRTKMDRYLIAVLIIGAIQLCIRGAPIKRKESGWAKAARAASPAEADMRLRTLKTQASAE